MIEILAGGVAKTALRARGNAAYGFMILIGWAAMDGDHPKDQREPNGMFRKRNWFADTWSLMLIGDRAEQPDSKRVYREALEWGLDVMRSPTHALAR